MDLEQNPPLLPYRINLTEGWVQNLDQVNRAGKIELKYLNKLLNVNLNIGWQYLDVSYIYSLVE